MNLYKSFESIIREIPVIAKIQWIKIPKPMPVSYTHLTLPTTTSV